MAVKTALESESMSASTEFVYTTYIKTTPERLWQALTDPAFSHNYMGHAMESDWTTGSTYVWDQDGLKIEHPDQVILESAPYRRLAFTFHTFVPELATVVGKLDQETIAKAAAERRSKVSFDIEPHGDQVKLTVIHDGFEPGSLVRQLISQGWPIKLANLKTALEQPVEVSAGAGPRPA
jgi:uncharacterized protein YndB with AHSA1/START domain